MTSDTSSIKNDKSLNYDIAFSELSEIVRSIETNQTSLDELAKKIKRATYLLEFCQENLRKTEEEYLRAMDQKNDNKSA